MGLLKNPSFCEELPGLQYAWDSTSIGALKECPRKYQLSIILGHTPKVLNSHLTFGLAYHSACERYDHGKAKGLSHDESLDLAVEYALETTWDRGRGRPWVSEEPNKTRFTLLRTLIWYLDQHKEDSFKTHILANGKPAVELSFRIELGVQTPFGKPYLLCGHFDKVGIFQEHYYILDKKSTKHALDDKYFGQYTPDNQISGYSVAGQIALGLPIKGVAIDAAQVGVTFSRFERRIIGRTPDQLDEWLKDLNFWIRQAEVYAEENYWPMNDKQCFGCSFRGICSKAPSVREMWIKNSFSNRTWNPLETRGDI